MAASSKDQEGPRRGPSRIPRGIPVEFYNVDVLGGKLVSDQLVQLSWQIAVGASAKGTLDCVSAWLTDFRKDLERIDVPTFGHSWRLRSDRPPRGQRKAHGRDREGRPAVGNRGGRTA